MHPRLPVPPCTALLCCQHAVLLASDELEAQHAVHCHFRQQQAVAHHSPAQTLGFDCRDKKRGRHGTKYTEDMEDADLLKDEEVGGAQGELCTTGRVVNPNMHELQGAARRAESAVSWSVLPAQCRGYNELQAHGHVLPLRGSAGLATANLQHQPWCCQGELGTLAHVQTVQWPVTMWGQACSKIVRLKTVLLSTGAQAEMCTLCRVVHIWVSSLKFLSERLLSAASCLFSTIDQVASRGLAA